MSAPTASQILAAFAAKLRFKDIPADVLEHARRCIIDTVGVATYGARFPWSRNLVRYASRYGSGGPCTVLGLPGVRLHAPYAALSNGAFAHAFEQDSLRYPGAGVHPGATLLPAALAMAEESGANGKTLLAAFVAGCEVMFRIGAASHHSSEALGFHAPGLTGPYGAAIAAGRTLGQDAATLARGLGIAGSLSAGILAFTKAREGTAVKRLHLGRAAEAGVLAARLAQEDLAGPETVLEGRFGFLETYCRDPDASRLTAGLGNDWETRKICIKAFPCHVTAHTPVQAIRQLMERHRFAGADAEEILVEGSPKLLSHHDIPEPRDLMQAQYSVPFCVALALYRDPADPESFSDEALNSPEIRAACRRVRLVPFPLSETPRSAWHTRISVRLRQGETLLQDSPSFRGMPESPPSRNEVRAKFMTLCAGLGGAQAARLLEKLESLEELSTVSLGSD